MQHLALEDIAGIHAEFRDHIADTIHANFDLSLPPAFGLVVVKNVGYCFNTFKAIGLLLPEYYYEQASALLRILWEAAVNLAWVASDPVPRAKLYAQFTVVERRKFIQMRIAEAQRFGASEDVVKFQTELRDFDDAFAHVLADYRFDGSKNQKRLRARFSSPTLESVVREIGEPWITEYRERYPLWCYYAHASPGAVLFPNPELVEITKEAFEAYDKPRTSQTALWSMAVMERVHFLACEIIGKSDRRYFDDLDACIQYRRSMRHPEWPNKGHAPDAQKDARK
jgi:hypothetical protein